MKKRVIILFTLGIFCFLLSSPVWAEFKLTPSISLREEYDDNIFLTADDEEDVESPNYEDFDNFENLDISDEVSDEEE